MTGRSKPHKGGDDGEPANPLTIGGRIRLERERLSMSHSDLALLLGVMPHIVIEMEKSSGSSDGARLTQFGRAGADVLFIVTGVRGHVENGARQSAADSFRAALSDLTKDERQRLLLHLVANELRHAVVSG